MHAFYSDQFVLPLPTGHRFPMEKYRLLRTRIAAELPAVRLCPPMAVSDETLALAHDPHYIARLTCGDLSRKEQTAIGFPWSLPMVERSRRSAGATVMACEKALSERVAVNLAGGTHHAHADRGEGFCCFNDAVVASRVLQHQHGVGAIAIIDLDVHQGNGTATMTEHDPTIFSLSLHGATNYPFRKARSSLDIDLPDGTQDADYLDALNGALATLATRFDPEFIIYLAGADPFYDDRLGRLALSKPGLQARDQRVFAFAEQHGLPVAVAMAGGYARTITDTVDIHFGTVSCALQYWRPHINL
jgi:acetoin utilization deacetylase AcuC-like enzyme